ncbi:hypothetical protein EUX98_g2345 [Antrodiella citrinella]|uniref:C-CAP/cofactor C-like domain-containing protein n=1 Tax=Antrodiella citrinella TaxID=2447956 RepID=A0A4S4N254_9APHY|nr:hypothetical protein EUX98_g2345 [Antrodiella citrinella]
MADTNRSLIEEFYASFNASRTDIASRLEVIGTAVSKSTEILDQLAVDVSKLRKELADATSFLPSYDQRQYELQVKSFEHSLEQLRVSAAPKPKFAFKRKAATPATNQTVSDAKKPGPATADLPSTASTIASNARALSNHTGQYLTSSSLPVSSSTAGSELTISDIDHCIVDLVSNQGEGSNAITAVHVKNVKRSVLLLPSMSGSAILHDVENTVLAIGCHQFRMHTSSHVDVYLSIPSNPIIEHCTHIRFTRYPTHLATSDSTAEASSTHLSVQDFSHIRATPSPNWKPLPEEAAIAEKTWPRALLRGDDDVESVLKRLLPPI